jgi:hypothetical protein
VAVTETQVGSTPACGANGYPSCLRGRAGIRRRHSRHFPRLGSSHSTQTQRTHQQKRSPVSLHSGPLFLRFPLLYSRPAFVFASRFCLCFPSLSLLIDKLQNSEHQAAILSTAHGNPSRRPAIQPVTAAAKIPLCRRIVERIRLPRLTAFWRFHKDCGNAEKNASGSLRPMQENAILAKSGKSIWKSRWEAAPGSRLTSKIGILGRRGL